MAAASISVAMARLALFAVVTVGAGLVADASAQTAAAAPADEQLLVLTSAERNCTGSVSTVTLPDRVRPQAGKTGPVKCSYRLEVPELQPGAGMFIPGLVADARIAVNGQVLVDGLRGTPGAVPRGLGSRPQQRRHRRRRVARAVAIACRRRPVGRSQPPASAALMGSRHRSGAGRDGRRHARSVHAAGLDAPSRFAVRLLRPQHPLLGSAHDLDRAALVADQRRALQCLVDFAVRLLRHHAGHLLHPFRRTESGVGSQYC